MKARDAAGRATHALKRFLARFDIDGAVFYGIMGRAWGLVAGPITVLLIATRFSPIIQGYFYTLVSLLALQVFVELGLGMVIVQFASHEWSRLRIEKGAVSGDPAAAARLASLLRFSLRWYGTGGCVLSLLLCGVGLIIFSRNDTIQGAWRAPWTAMCILAGITLVTVPFFSILAGCNQVSRTNRFKMIQSIIINLSMWASIAAGGNLWTSPLSMAVGVLCSVLFFRFSYGEFFRSLFTSPSTERIAWNTEILPMQWRIALSWLAGLLIYHLFTPILFHYQGAVVAGQMGMTWTLLLAISDISVTWVTARNPEFGILIARKDYAALDRLFFRSAGRSLSLLTAGLALIVGVIALLYGMHHPLAGRLLPPIPTALFAFYTFGNSVAIMMGVYLRSHKKEPYLWTSVIGGACAGLASFLLGRSHGAVGMGWWLFVLTGIFMIANVIIFLRCRERWHSQK